MAMKSDVLQLVNLIYEAAVDVEAWDTALIAIADALGDADAMVFQLVDLQSDRAPLVVAPRTDPEWLRTYVERWVPADFVRKRGLLLPTGAVYQFEHLLDRSEFDNSPYYNEFFVPQQLHFGLMTNAAKGRNVVAGVGFFRSADRGRFSARDERLLAALAPHLERAAALNLRLGRLEMERHSAVETLNRCAHGVILVDATAHILFANMAADAMLRDGSRLRSRRGRLATRVAAKTNALRAMVGGGVGGTPGGLLALPGLDGPGLTALVQPIRSETAWLPRHPTAAVFVVDPTSLPLPSSEVIRLVFDLTPAQASLAREIVLGDGIDAAAQRLSISRNTARTHLAEIFQRTGTGRQAELVRLILQSNLPVREL